MRALLLPVLLATFCAPGFSFAAETPDGDGQSAPPAEAAPADQPVTPGYVGKNFAPPGRAPTDADTEFVPFGDRWRIPLPKWDRYPGRSGEYPFTQGHWWDPFDENVIKGDYPIFGNEVFFIFTGTSETLFEAHRVPTPSGASTADPEKSNEFFGQSDQLVFNQNWLLSFDLFHGNTGFKPRDWTIKITPIFNINYVDVGERQVDINPAEGTTRFDDHISLQDAFVEYEIADLSPWYDFVSVRAGIQPFTSDFRGFIFSDSNLGARFFGNYGSNRHQYNVAYFRPLEKDTNSGLNRIFVNNPFDSREEDVVIANYYRQDTIWDGYTAQFSFHYNGDHADHLHFDRNSFIVRPAAIGSIVGNVGGDLLTQRNKADPGFGKPIFHHVDAYYLGWAGDGHIGWLNVNHAFYQVFGQDDRNPIAGRRVDINAQMAAVELSFDRDWLTFKGSFFYASGDGNPHDSTARGFDTILDNTNFAGGGFSYWDRQGLGITDARANLNGRLSLLPSLRSSKIEGQPNFVNPGLFLYNVGVTADVTPKLRMFFNLNYLEFAKTDSIEVLLQQKNIDREIGLDYGVGLLYRPFLNENVVLSAGAAALTPFQGLRDVLEGQTLYSTFFAATLVF